MSYSLSHNESMLASATGDLDLSILSETSLETVLQSTESRMTEPLHAANGVKLEGSGDCGDNVRKLAEVVSVISMKDDRVMVSRKSQRSKRPPKQFLKPVSLAVERSKRKRKSVKPSKVMNKRDLVQFPQNSKFPDFKCDLCGSRYVVNPMRRASRVRMVSYEPFPRHKVDPVTQEILTLCNACGLSFGRERKRRTDKVAVTDEDRKKFFDEGEAFGKELAVKLENENAGKLFCSQFKSTPCGCIQKFICKDEQTNMDDVLKRAGELVEIMQVAAKLKTLKCYDSSAVQKNKRPAMIGLGNGHRRSQQYEEFVLTKRNYLRNDLHMCEKAAQKILMYSNNFLHKRMKTDPGKPVRVERQKGKAATGNLKPIQDLPLETCCVDSCVRMALTHSRLLEQWRLRAMSSQLEARRVLAEMLTPSGGQRANCYKFIMLVTGCSNSTIGKVNAQMRITGGDREPPEHGLKKYWKELREARVQAPMQNHAYSIASHGILQEAVNLSGLSSISQDSLPPPPQPPPPKRRRRTKQADKTAVPEAGLPTKVVNTTMELIQSGNANSVDLQGTVVSNAPSSTILSLNADLSLNAPQFIAIPAPVGASGTITIPTGLSLQNIQQQLQQQQQLQLQIQLLQQQLQSSTQTTQVVAEQNRLRDGQPSDYIVTVSKQPQQSLVPNVVTPVTVEGSTAGIVIGGSTGISSSVNLDVNQSMTNISVDPDSVMHRVVTNTNNLLVAQDNVNVLNSHTLTAKAAPGANGFSVLSASRALSESIASYQPVTIITSPSAQIAPVSQSAANLHPVTIITSPLPAMTSVAEPVAISLQTPPAPTLPLSNLPTMIVTQPVSEGRQQAVLTSLGSAVSLVPPQSVSTLKVGGTYSLSVKSDDKYSLNTPQMGVVASSVPVSTFSTDTFLAEDSQYTVLADAGIAQLQTQQSTNQDPMRVSFAVD